MHCRSAGRLMSLRLDAALDPDQEAQLARHLERCPRCRAAWAAMQELDSRLRCVPWAEPRPGLAGRVLARLPVERCIEPVEMRRSVVPSLLPRPRAGTAILAAVALLLLLLTAVALILGTAPGRGEWLRIPPAVSSTAGALWNGLFSLLAASGILLRTLWHALAWPWLPIGLLLAASALCAWLWIRQDGGRRSA
ncbi:MAG: anti-sigma factor family protein [Chloroflexia bacterium]